MSPEYRNYRAFNRMASLVVDCLTNTIRERRSFKKLIVQIGCRIDWEKFVVSRFQHYYRYAELDNGSRIKSKPPILNHSRSIRSIKRTHFLIKHCLHFLLSALPAGYSQPDPMGRIRLLHNRNKPLSFLGSVLLYRVLIQS